MRVQTPNPSTTVTYMEVRLNLADLRLKLASDKLRFRVSESVIWAVRGSGA